jgi:hypothetical protein
MHRTHILLSQIRDVPVFIHPRNRVFQLYPEALSSPFVASYDSQGYGGGIRSRLHTGWGYTEPQAVLRYDTVRVENDTSKNSSIAVCIHCRWNVFTEPLPSNHAHTDWWEGFMEYAGEMGSGAVTYTPSFIKISSGVQNLIGIDT